MNAILPILLTPFIFFLAIASILWHFSRGRDILTRWATTNGFTVLSADYRFVCRGPFFFRTGKGQSVYYVTLADAESHIHHAYIRVGGWFLGLFSDTIKVEWAD